MTPSSRCHYITGEIKLAHEMISQPHKTIPCLNKQMNDRMGGIQRKKWECRKDKAFEGNAFQKEFVLMWVFYGGSEILRGEDD